MDWHAYRQLLVSLRRSNGVPDIESLHRGARRAHARLPLDAEVRLSADAEVARPGGGLAVGVALNLSGGGMRVAVDRDLPVNAQLVALVSLPSGDQVVESVRVVWMRRHTDGCVAGLAFARPAISRLAA